MADTALNIAPELLAVIGVTVRAAREHGYSRASVAYALMVEAGQQMAAPVSVEDRRAVALVAYQTADQIVARGVDGR